MPSTIISFIICQFVRKYRMIQPNNEDGRNCWASARERNRLRARYHIRERVAQGQCTNTQSLLLLTHEVDPSITAEYLRYIQAGDRSKFSLSRLDRNFDLISSPIPMSTILQYTRPIDSGSTTTTTMTVFQHSIQLCTAWFGAEYAQALERYMLSLENFFIMEYAIWMGKYSIVAALLAAGVNPCLRGRSREHESPPLLPLDSKPESSSTTTTQTQPIVEEWCIELGSRVLQRFFDCFPSLLSTYIIKRVVELRQDRWEFHNRTHCVTTNTTATSTMICVNCDKHEDNLLFFRSCEHCVCEACWWIDILEHVDQRGDCDDVVLCPKCGMAGNNHQNTQQHQHLSSGNQGRMNDIDTTPLHRKQNSLAKFASLPLDRQALKSSDTKKKKKVNENEQWASSWTVAILPCLGSTQTVRQDKFRSFVERNALHHVRACLYAGVEVDERNEYGQTALYVCAWKNHHDVAVALLHYGANPNLTAHDGSSPYQIASLLGHDELRQLLAEKTESLVDLSLDTRAHRHETFSSCQLPLSLNVLSLSTLIPLSYGHPGAGSYTIDNAVSDVQIEYLIELHRNIPVDPTQKPKAGLCSERSYVCDASGMIQKGLKEAMLHSGLEYKTIQFFPHMRFLHYSIVGTTLNPHVDICRVDADSGIRSTHTFILYLHDCNDGGETCLLEQLSGASKVLACVSPRRGRLLLFPHNCPHEGRQVQSVPKLLLRGEVVLSMTA